ncbi:hypothetical protein BSZ32_13895 [Rubritalea profundi]|uniref:PDZ domain-containing protein n=2 Tax=Rubritalea profundi TaxID=1658618 RepID=A0A2S7U4Z9_9BACT|nr:hypothetical protein BSZ32_13895 [Rubritalea profundi]
MLATTTLATAEDYYKETPQFHMYPDPAAARYIIKRFGPVGIGLELRKPNFTMHITGVEKGSPAEACGKLKKGQIIETINGKTLKDIDPRVLLGNMITEAEAKGGIMKMMVKDDPKSAAKEVVVKIPALGAYSKTWPVDCKKSDKIVRACADALAANKESVKIGVDGALMFLLSTGEEKDLDVVRGWIKKIVEKYKDKEEISSYPWFAGYSGTGLCEYYLRTGDKSILPTIEKLADYLKRTIYNGSWMGRGGASYAYMGGGHLNAAGLHAVTFLLMAKECGVKVDEHTLQSSLHHIYRFAGHGDVAYGDHLPEGGFAGNGKTEGLAFTMQAAANLHPDGEKSIYAKARNVSGTKAFYSTSWLFHGHTGGGIGEYWRGPAMGVVRDKRPAEYQSFMDERRWMYELGRTHDGVFGWVSGWNVSYDKTGLEGRGFANFIPLIYTLPRKHLRLYGAPRSKYSHTYAIPDRPWGNKADEIFLSMVPGEYKPGKRQDTSKERLRTDASMPILGRLNDPKVSDDTLLMYAYHFDQALRTASARAINKHGRYHLVVPLLKSKDPRARLTGVTCIIGMGKGKALPKDQLTDEVFALVAEMINDKDEAWWVLESAFKAIGLARPELVAPHVPRLISWLDHDDWWMRAAAMHALTPVATDKKLYKQILPKIGKIVQSTQRLGDLQPIAGIVRTLQDADPEVRKFAMATLGESYVNFPTELAEPGGQDLTKNIELMLGAIAKDMITVPGGYDYLYRIAKKRDPKVSLPHPKLFLGSDGSQFGPELKQAFVPIIKDQLIPEYIEKNRRALDKELITRQPGRAIDGLVALYKKAGNHDYDWKLHGPARDKIEWQYHTFDPKEKKLWESGHRFREVTLPAGNENWFKPEFDPKKAGWKTGFAPFANNGGKLASLGECNGDHYFCGCDDEPNTFWDKEALLMRAKIELPPLREGYAYRMLVGGRSHYNAGGGTDVWLDGEHLKNARKGWATIPGGSGRNSSKPWGVTITDDARKYFEDGKLLLACNGFLRWGHRSEQIKSYKSFWFEQMKLPELPAAPKPKE